jgi:hypothetical protein
MSQQAAGETPRQEYGSTPGVEVGQSADVIVSHVHTVFPVSRNSPRRAEARRRLKPAPQKPEAIS